MKSNGDIMFSALEHGFPWADLGLGARAAHLNAVVLGIENGACVLGR